MYTYTAFSFFFLLFNILEFFTIYLSGLFMILYVLCLLIRYFPFTLTSYIQRASRVLLLLWFHYYYHYYYYDFSREDN